MSNQNKLIDAVKTAKSIHDGDYSSLRNKSFLIRVNMKKKRRGKRVKKSNKGKMTLAKLAKQINARFDNLEKRIDGIDARLDYNNLKKLPTNSK